MVDAKLFVCSNASGKSDYHFIKTKSSISKWRFNIRITANCNLPKRTFGIDMAHIIWDLFYGLLYKDLGKIS